jgi:hypothetical protein
MTVKIFITFERIFNDFYGVYSNVQILILLKNDENNRKKLANNIRSIVIIDHQIYPLVPSFRFFVQF